MAVPIFPLTLSRKAVKDGWQESIPNSTLRYDMDFGTKVRNEGHSKPYIMKFEFVVTTEEWATLRKFIVEVCANGARAFDFTNPIDGQVVRAAFKPVSDDEIVTRTFAGTSTDRFQVQSELEIFYDMPLV